MILRYQSNLLGCTLTETINKTEPKCWVMSNSPWYLFWFCNDCQLMWPIVRSCTIYMWSCTTSLLLMPLTLKLKVAPMIGLRTLIPLFVFYCLNSQKKILPGLLYYSCCHDKYLLQQAVFLPILTLWYHWHRLSRINSTGWEFRISIIWEGNKGLCTMLYGQ